METFPGVTYKQLKEELEKLTEEQLNCQVSVYIPWDDEYWEIDSVAFATAENGVLDAEHPILHLAY